METFSALLAICAGNSPYAGEFPAQRPVTGSFDVFSDLRLNKPLSKQSGGWWFETLSCPLWRHRNAIGFLDKMADILAMSFKCISFSETYCVLKFRFQSSISLWVTRLSAAMILTMLTWQVLVLREEGFQLQLYLCRVSVEE